jgi:hypothetical protein
MPSHWAPDDRELPAKVLQLLRAKQDETGVVTANQSELARLCDTTAYQIRLALHRLILAGSIGVYEPSRSSKFARYLILERT